MCLPTCQAFRRFPAPAGYLLRAAAILYLCQAADGSIAKFSVQDVVTRHQETHQGEGQL